MNLEQVRYFSAVTYDDSTYKFAVTPEDEIYCFEFDIAKETKKIELKPNFILRDENGRSFYSLDDFTRERKIKKSLIKEWIIDDALFEYLIENNMIMYSTQMALLYGLDPQYAFDAHYQKRAFKSSRNNPLKRTRVLQPMKSGKFN